jgi:hypothetical protein
MYGGKTVFLRYLKKDARVAFARARAYKQDSFVGNSENAQKLMQERESCVPSSVYKDTHRDR